MHLTRRRALQLAMLTAFAPAARAKTIHDATGKPIEAGTALRIVAVGSDVTEVIFALGEGARVVAVDTTSTYPAEARALPNVGYMRALSAEGVLALNPDLIIANAGAGPPEVIAALQQGQVPLITIDDAASADAVAGKIAVIGQMLGVEEKAAKLAGSIRSRFASLAQAIATLERPRAMFILSLTGGRILAGGAGSAADAIIALAGGQNALGEFQGYKPVTEEAVLAAAPEAIVMMNNRSHAGSPEQFFAQQPFASTPAAQARRLITMDGSYLLAFGPRAADAARDLAEYLHPGIRLPAFE